MADSSDAYEIVEQIESPAGLAVAWARSPEGLPVRLTRTAPGLDVATVSGWFDTWQVEAVLEHPAVVRVVGSGHEGGAAWVAHEVVDGITLDRMLTALSQTGHLFPADVLLDLGARLSDALAHVHAAAGQGGRQLMLTHGGVRTSAVWLTRDGRVQLDGFRCHVPPTTADAYLAPELRAGAKPDPRADLYGLGVMLAELCVGRVPDLSDANRLLATLGQRRDLPESLPGLVAELCAPLPDQRPQLARMLTQRLDNLRGLVEPTNGLAAYVQGGVEHLSPTSQALTPQRLRAEAEAQGPYPPPPSTGGFVMTPVAPGADEAWTPPAPSGDALPRLTLPRPDDAPTGAPLVDEAPAQLDAVPALEELADVPTGPTPRWQPTADGGLPVWLMVTLGVLAVVGAVSVSRWLFVDDDPAAAPGPTKPISALTPKQAKTPNLEVTSEPPGAVVFVDGVRQDDPTPLEIFGLRHGHKVSIVVTKVGFRDTTPRVVTLPNRRGEVARVHFGLTASRRFQIVSAPEGATGIVDGDDSKLRTTPFWVEGVSVGDRVEIALSKRGFLPETVHLRVAANTATVTSVAMKPARLFSVESTPSGATVRIDGVAVGKTPLEEHPVAQGRRFELEIARPDTRPYKRTLTARGKLVHKVKANLRLLPLAKMPLLGDERRDLERITGELDEARRALREANARLKAANQEVRRLERAAAIKVSEVEAAQDTLEEAQNEARAAKLTKDNKVSELDALRTEVAKRLAESW